jgi:PAS domain S-box-containing protein
MLGNMSCEDEPGAEAYVDLLHSPDRFEAILSSISEGVFTVDTNFRIACFNQAAERITGFQRSEVLGRSCQEVLQGTICKDACALKYTMETGSPVVELTTTLRDRDGKDVPVAISTAVLHDEAGNLLGGVESFRDLRLVESLRRKIEQRYTFEDIIGKSRPMRSLFEILPTIANGGSNILIIGESGTGKELFARALHRLGPRADGPFVAVNSGALPDTLIESELFGYRAGAFTGANRDRPGRIATAERGTLFLDEIGDLPLGLQVKILRFLQEKVYEPLGDSKPHRADVSIIAATNQSLERLVAEKRFREDLYYRLNVIRLEIPPLRERMDDVVLLVDHFIAQLSVMRHKPVTSMAPEALEVLLGYDYPGNVRELHNIVEHAFVLCPGGTILRQHLPLNRMTTYRAGSKDDGSPSPSPTEIQTLGQKQAIVEALRQAGWNRQKAADLLSIHKTTLFRRIRRLGIELPSMDGRSRYSR